MTQTITSWATFTVDVTVVTTSIDPHEWDNITRDFARFAARNLGLSMRAYKRRCAANLRRLRAYEKARRGRHTRWTDEAEEHRARAVALYDAGLIEAPTP